MKQKPPQTQQYGLAGTVNETVLARPRKQDDFRRHLTVRLDAELSGIDDFKKVIAVDDVAFAVRHLEAKAGKAAVTPDDPAKDTGKYEYGCRLRRSDGVVYSLQGDRRARHSIRCWPGERRSGFSRRGDYFSIGQTCHNSVLWQIFRLGPR
ncbi:MAG: hypothetical protein LLG00_17145 [Planctomycetaceae bacterium]|nr:hypothetical protein [Planctomycetaceae bacterium]